MKYCFAIPILLLSITFETFAEEDCELTSLGLDSRSSDIQKHYYIGTCHYRNNEYELSVKNWEKLPALKPKSSDEEALKVNVLNNLAYMKFFGFGTTKNQSLALSYWQRASSLGHDEAEYHLCHAYADEKQATYNIAKARKHCERARLIYKAKDEPGSEILSDIEAYMKKIAR